MLRVMVWHALILCARFNSLVKFIQGVEGWEPMEVPRQRCVVPGTLKQGRWDTVIVVVDAPQFSVFDAGSEGGVWPWPVSAISTGSGTSDQWAHFGTRTAPCTVTCDAVSERFSRGCAPSGIKCPGGAPVVLTRCHEFIDTVVTETRGVDVGARTAPCIVPCGAVSERFSRGCAPSGIKCPGEAPVTLTRCHEFVDTTVTETRGDDVLDLRATRGSRGSVQSHRLLDMETPVGAILSSTYTGTVRLEPVTPSQRLAQ